MTQPTDKDICKYFEITPQTFCNWKKSNAKEGKKRMLRALREFYIREVLK